MSQTTYNPLTKANTASEPEEIGPGTRLAFNPGRRGWPLLVVGEVLSVSAHPKHGRVAVLKPDPECGMFCARVSVPVDRLTVKVLRRPGNPASPGS